ncbi:MAG: hypothetical protein S4CHLAM6_10920 [Chlamydiae bacterium]|nr:hypothetical protein [Chlamydiota bacterium]
MKKFFVSKKTKYVVSALILIPLGLVGEYSPDLNLNQDQYVSYMARNAQSRQRRKSSRNRLSRSEQKAAQAKLDQSWSPNFVPSKYIQEKRSPFFQYNIGVGFLYFSDVSANLGGSPAANFQTPLPNFDDVQYRGPLKYNRTPLFEAMIGYRVWSWFKFALSYQHQGGMTVNTMPLTTTNSPDGRALFSSQLNLDAIMAKFYFELPWAMVVKNLATSPYLAVGAGPGWQSWTCVRSNNIDVSGIYRNRILWLNDKTSANATWMVDLGFRMQDAMRKQNFSVELGCKYNQWGQARNIGGFRDQGEFPLGLAHPFKVKTVYSFAPYLGVQWNFPPSYIPKSPIMVNGKMADSWVPFWVQANQFKDPGIWTQFNVGVGFLYFKNVDGVIVADGPTPRPTLGRPFQFGPLRGGFSYNRTPLMEYILGWRIKPWLRTGISAQYQSQVCVQSKWQAATGTFSEDQGVTSNEPHLYRLKSSLNLNSVMLRLFYDSHWSMIFKGVNFTPFIGAGIGPAWQTWRDIEVQDTLVVTGNLRNNNPVFLVNKTSANASFLVDVGMKLKSLLPEVDFSMTAGLKFMYWGQARNIGDLSQQDGSKRFLVRPLNIKNVYSFAPYLGAQWNFPDTYTSRGPYAIAGREINTWSPFFTDSYEVQSKASLWTQFNMGVGFLYFSGVRGNLAGIPASSFNFEVTDKPLHRGLKYNRSPLFEYLVGYRFNNWIKGAISYQRQSSVTLQTEPQDGNIPNPATDPATRTTLRANLELNAILAKTYFELPYALIFKSTATSPYLAIGVGPGWQTWQTSVQHIRMDSGFLNYITKQPLKRKICTNAVWMLDLGFRIRSAYPNGPFSVNLGCKYNQWGQARNIGLMSQQGAAKQAIRRPFIVKTIYQFAPYLGVQWNF